MISTGLVDGKRRHLGITSISKKYFCAVNARWERGWGQRVMQSQVAPWIVTYTTLADFRADSGPQTA